MRLRRVALLTATMLGTAGVPKHVKLVDLKKPAQMPELPLAWPCRRVNPVGDWWARLELRGDRIERGR
jgi:hypothetical protein